MASMCGYEEESAPRLRAADLARLAAERAEQLREEGVELHAVPAPKSARKLAERFWGAAWMRHLAQCEAGGLCLAPGRTLLRQGCVLDLRITPGSITALVSAQELYEVHLRLKPLCSEQREQLAALCSGRVSSLVALLEGKTNDELLHTLCEPETGLLPAPQDWHMSCTCPDWAEPCPHAAAAIYAAGLLIDRDPALLFTLRSLDPAALISLPASPATSAELDPATLGNTFGIEIEL